MCESFLVMLIIKMSFPQLMQNDSDESQLLAYMNSFLLYNKSGVGIKGGGNFFNIINSGVRIREEE